MNTPINEAVESATVAAGRDIILRVAGSRFRCNCGCNVFQHPEGEPNIYRCNGCDTEYEADNE